MVVETICRTLKEMMLAWGIGGAAHIEIRISRENLEEDKLSLHILLCYVLKDVAKGAWAQHSGTIKACHRETMRLVQFVDEGALQVGAELSEGRHNVVFKAFWMSEHVAVKKSVQRARTGDMALEELAEFLREILTHAALNDDPYVVRPLAATPCGWKILKLADFDLCGLCYYVKRVPWATKIRLLREAAAGLAFMHSQNRVHGDVHPRKFLIFGSSPETYHLKISDIGLSCTAIKLTSKGMSMGRVTPLRAAPEWYRGQPINRESDVYSFGVVCHELISQMQPFGGRASKRFAIMTKKLRGDAPCHVRPELCPPQMLALVTRCYAINPAERPTTEEVCRSLHQLSEDWRPLEEKVQRVQQLVHQLQPLQEAMLYNRCIMDFLETQLQHVRNLDVPQAATQDARVNFNLQIGRGERLLRKHVVLFDVKDFYTTEVAHSAVEAICECLKEALCEWNLPEAAYIETAIPAHSVEADKTLLHQMLSYLLRDKDCTVEDEILQRWDDSKKQHAQNMKALKIIHEDALVIGSELGEGGQGTVFSASWGSRAVAVKKRSCDQHADIPIGTYAEFLREAMVHAELCDHDHIIRLLAITISGSIVMELADSHLSKWCHVEERLPWFSKAKLLQQGSAALAHIHSKKRVHGDVKPRNFLICGTCPEDRCLKISDFGLACEEAESRNWTVRILRGTSRWIAPEVYDGKPVTQESDVFSFGVLCYEVISQQLPYGWRSTEYSIMKRKASGKPPCCIRVPQDCPPEALEIMKACCAIEPSERPTMKEVDNRFKDLLKPRRPGENVTSSG